MIRASYTSKRPPVRAARKAHEMIEGKHTRGKIVLQVAA
jgi:hypothetical protein